MKNSGKIVIILLILLAAAAIGISTVIYLSWEKEKNQAVSLSKKITQLESEKLDLEKDVDRYKKEASEVRARFEQSEKRVQELTISLDDEARQKENVTMQLAALKRDLDGAKNLKLELERKISQGEQEVSSFKEQIAQLQKSKEDLENKLKEATAKADVQLGKIIIGTDNTVQQGGADVSAGGLAGRVLVVNKEYAFAVINLGSKNGVTNGQVFSVYQDSNYIGDIVVERVDETMASANFSDPALSDLIREDDKVLLKAP